MDVPKINGKNGKNWLAKGLIQILLVVALIAYSAVLTIKDMGGQSKQSPQIVQDTMVIDRLARIETGLENLGKTVDKIDKKLDSHIDKEK